MGRRQQGPETSRSRGVPAAPRRLIATESIPVRFSLDRPLDGVFDLPLATAAISPVDARPQQAPRNRVSSAPPFLRQAWSSVLAGDILSGDGGPGSERATCGKSSAVSRRTAFRSSGPSRPPASIAGLNSTSDSRHHAPFEDVGETPVLGHDRPRPPPLVLVPLVVPTGERTGTRSSPAWQSIPARSVGRLCRPRRTDVDSPTPTSSPPAQGTGFEEAGIQWLPRFLPRHRPSAQDGVRRRGRVRWGEEEHAVPVRNNLPTAFGQLTHRLDEPVGPLLRCADCPADARPQSPDAGCTVPRIGCETFNRICSELAAAGRNPVLARQPLGSVRFGGEPVPARSSGDAGHRPRRPPRMVRGTVIGDTTQSL